MKVIHSIDGIRKWVLRAQQNRQPIGLVPTMGALHAGHMSLLQHARKIVGQKGLVAASIFVNPTQFNQKSDLAKYPRQLARDLVMCRAAKADLVFAPSVKSIYPPNFSTWVEEIELSKFLCGASRPGHFRGVCTIVLKLFNLVQPQVAIFGQKDVQQVQVISRMTRDLNMPVKIIIAPTVSESDGLAMSSRNQRLSVTEREHAKVLYHTLQLINNQFKSGTKKTVTLKKMGTMHLKKIPDLKIDYLEIVDSSTLRSVTHCSKGNLIVVAAYIGKVRLIDNLRL